MQVKHSSSWLAFSSSSSPSLPQFHWNSALDISHEQKLIIFPAEYSGKVQSLTHFPEILRCLCKSFQNNPPKCQKPPSSFSKLKSTGEPDSKYSGLHQVWKNYWEFSSDHLSEVEKKSCFPQPLGMGKFQWGFSAPGEGDLQFQQVRGHSSSTLSSAALGLSPFITDGSTSIKDNKFLPFGILPCPFKAHTRGWEAVFKWVLKEYPQSRKWLNLFSTPKRNCSVSGRAIICWKKPSSFTLQLGHQ